MPGTLYIVATPIGNLEDISLRALRLLREVDLIAAEDTRVTRKLLSHYDIHTPLISYHQHSRGEKAESLVDRLISGQAIALVSDAGTPGISDPGADLIRRALDANVSVIPIPGANAAVAALVASGLPTGRFSFEGFPPRTKTDRREFFADLRDEPRTVILYESAQRMDATLSDLYAAIGDRPVALARELTKKFEEIFRGCLSAAIHHCDEHKPRGEFTIVIGPPEKSIEERQSTDPRAALRKALDTGATPRDAVQQVAADLHLPRRTVYRAMLELTR
jgi:16S rRNA (cytidine1402-2'-O)-methyltransferase